MYGTLNGSVSEKTGFIRCMINTRSVLSLFKLNGICDVFIVVCDVADQKLSESESFHECIVRILDHRRRILARFEALSQGSIVKLER